jgi:hypothetical protein
VRAADARVAGQRGQRVERGQHLRGRAFEETAASAGEKRVAAKEQRRAAFGGRKKVRDVPGRVARHIDDLEAQAERFGDVALHVRREGLGDAFAGGTVHRHARGGVQRGHAARVIGVVVRD